MNRPLSGTLMDPLIHLIAAESDVPLNPRLAALDTFHACCVAAR